MKNWKIKELALVALATFTLAACGTNEEKPAEKADSTPTEEVQKQELKATFEIKDGDQTLADEEVAFEEGATVFSVLEENFEVEAEDTDFGKYIKAIEGVSEDTEAGKYWLYTVNDEMAEVGAGEYELKDGDQVTWTLEAM